MSDSGEKFKTYSHEYSRLHDPEVEESSAKFVPAGRQSHVAGSWSAGREAGAGGGDGGDRWTPVILGRAEQHNLDGLNPLEAYLGECGASREAAAWHPPPAPGVEITLSPATMTCRVALHEEVRFETVMPGARGIELVWEAAGGGTQQRVVMDAGRRGLFSATVNMPDGGYACGYVADGYARPDARHAQRLLVRRDGVYGLLRLSRQRRTVSVCNHGAGERTLLVQTDVPWIAAEGVVSVPPRGKARKTFSLIPQRLSLGLNEGTLRLVSRRREGDAVVAEARIRAVGEMSGAIPEVRCSPTDLGHVVYGAGDLRLIVEVTARGSGELVGIIILSHTSEVVRFRLSADGCEPRFEHTFVVDSGKLPYRAEGVLKASVVTNSYLATRRLIEAELPYRLLYLRKSLIALHFGQMRAGEARTLNLKAEPSDGRGGEVEVSIPAAIRRHLQVSKTQPNVYAFRFNTEGLNPGTVISEAITLSDRATGLRDTIRLFVEVGGG